MRANEHCNLRGCDRIERTEDAVKDLTERRAVVCSVSLGSVCVGAVCLRIPSTTLFNFGEVELQEIVHPREQLLS